MNLKPLADETLERHLSSLPPDGISRFSLLDGTIRGAVLSATTLSAQMRANHELGLLESLALSQAAMAALLSSVTLKDGDRIAFRMDCSGPLEGFSVESTWDGRVRGYVFNGTIPIEGTLESFSLKPFIGSGTLSVIRSNERGQSFTGQVELESGSIAEDVTAYFLKSEQTKTALAVSVKFDRRGRLIGAGGLFLQAMPGAKAIDIEDTEDRIAELPSIATYLSEGKDRKKLVEEFYEAFGIQWLGDTDALFACECSRERFAGFLGSLKGDELQRLISEGPHPAELVCHNCGSRYLFSKAELEQIAGL